MNPYTIYASPSQVLIKTAENHRKIRKSKKWTQVELAERTGVSLGSIKRFEQSGKISFSSLLKLAHALGRLSDFEKLFEVDELSNIEKLFSKKMRGE